jgi:hypothetical protein
MHYYVILVKDRVNAFEKADIGFVFYKYLSEKQHVFANNSQIL